MSSPMEQNTQQQSSHKKKTVLNYLVVLFACAFLLMLLSYFMQQRTNAEMISNLESASASSLQSLSNLVKENDRLKAEAETGREELDALREQLAEAEARLAAGELALAQQSDSLAAMDYLRLIQRFYTRQSYRSARALIERFEELGLRACLPDEPVVQDEANALPSPLEQYEAIYDALF